MIIMIGLLFMIEVHIRKLSIHTFESSNPAVGNGISDPLRCPRSVPPESTAVAAVVADMNATMGRAIEKLLTPAPVADGIRKN
jgi:hypothetical protein